MLQVKKKDIPTVCASTEIHFILKNMSVAMALSPKNRNQQESIPSLQMLFLSFLFTDFVVRFHMLSKVISSRVFLVASRKRTRISLSVTVNVMFVTRNALFVPCFDESLYVV